MKDIKDGKQFLPLKGKFSKVQVTVIQEFEVEV